MTPDVSRLKSDENYRGYDHRGLPFIGAHQPMRPDEYLAKTAVVARGCFGNFDTAIPDEMHFQRTLNEVLSKVAVGEYRLLQQVPHWIQCPKFGVRVMQYIQWVEYSDRLATESIKNATTSITNTFQRG